MSPPKASARPLAAANPLFKWILIFVGGLGFLCLFGSFLLACVAADPMTKAQDNFSSLCIHGFMTTLALFVGLAGGRAGHPDYFGQLPAGG
jgi:hypothetical protein